MAEPKRHMDVPQGACFGSLYPMLAERRSKSLPNFNLSKIVKMRIGVNLSSDS
jgi:hypothetical protein